MWYPLQRRRGGPWRRRWPGRRRNGFRSSGALIFRSPRQGLTPVGSAPEKEEPAPNKDKSRDQPRKKRRSALGGESLRRGRDRKRRRSGSRRWSRESERGGRRRRRRLYSQRLGAGLRRPRRSRTFQAFGLAVGSASWLAHSRRRRLCPPVGSDRRARSRNRRRRRGRLLVSSFGRRSREAEILKFAWTDRVRCRRIAARIGHRLGKRRRSRKKQPRRQI